MILVMCAIRDRALDAYMRPFFAQTKAQAIRMFQDEINRPESEMYKHAHDYDLYALGNWNDETGKLDEDLEQLALGKNAALKSNKTIVHKDFARKA